nr:FeoA family protein [uncultured Desulfobulbus sp.]
MRHRHGMPTEQQTCTQVPPQAHSQLFPLALAGVGEVVTVASLPVGTKLQERLMSMGINLHDEITVVQKQGGGALLIEKDGVRFALGGGMALKINVAKV